MTTSRQKWLERIPFWMWICFVPIVGGVVHIYAGCKTKTTRWIWWGLCFIASSFILGYLHPPLLYLIISAQAVTAFSLKKSFLMTIAPPGVITPTNSVVGLLPDNSLTEETKENQNNNQEPIDINRCTKDDIVYGLGLSIIYANDIELLRNEGFVFTDINELSDIVGIPQSIVQRIEPLIVFRYYEQEVDLSWRRLNYLSVEELVELDVDRSSAEQIVAERENKGTYQSLVDVRKRTSIPLKIYRHLA